MATPQPEELGWADMLKVYVAGDKAMFVKVRDRLKEAMAQMDAILSLEPAPPDELLTALAAGFDAAAESLAPAIHDTRMLAVGLEENRRMLLSLRAQVTPKG